MAGFDDGLFSPPETIVLSQPTTAPAAAPPPAPPKAPQSHQTGHRERLRRRFLNTGGDGVADYELLELLLFRAIPRRDVKPLAKALIDRFGSFSEVLMAPPEQLREAGRLGDAAVTDFKIVAAAAQLLVRGDIAKKTLLASAAAVLDYCRAAMAFSEREEFRILFLNKRNMLILDEVQGTGTVDHTPVYPREVIKRALTLNASALILVHNHPSGDPTPSQSDIVMTRQIVALAKPLDIEIHDHLIVGRNGHASLRKLKLM